MSYNYVLIEWPESQDFMEEKWFQGEAILANEDQFSSSSYFIPEERIINNEYILQRSKELAKELKSTDEEDKYINSQWEKEGLPFEGGMNTFESVLNLKLITLNNERI
jgi:hypothetical protein